MKKWLTFLSLGLHSHTFIFFLRFFLHATGLQQDFQIHIADRAQNLPRRPEVIELKDYEKRKDPVRAEIQKLTSAV